MVGDSGVPRNGDNDASATGEHGLSLLMWFTHDIWEIRTTQHVLICPYKHTQHDATITPVSSNLAAATHPTCELPLHTYFEHGQLSTEGS